MDKALITPQVDLAYKVSLISDTKVELEVEVEANKEKEKDKKVKQCKTKKPRRNELSGLGIRKEDGEFIVSFL
jgi:hypothetical protein